MQSNLMVDIVVTKSYSQTLYTPLFIIKAFSFSSCELDYANVVTSLFPGTEKFSRDNTDHSKGVY